MLLHGTSYSQARIRVPLAMVNRHGLIAGATGTGKTKTLQLMAEQLSAMGVPVFAADVKGDLSGLLQAGEAERPDHRTGAEDRRRLGADGHPVELPGARRPRFRRSARATVSSFGPHLLAKVLGCERDAGVVARSWSSTSPTRPAWRCSTSTTCAPSSST